MSTDPKKETNFSALNSKDQWSEIIQVLQSIDHQMETARRALLWMEEEDLSRDGLADAIFTEIYVLNKGELFDYNRRYIDLEQRSILDDFPDDTRHAIGRLVAKAERRPRQRLQAKLVNFHMWFDLAWKCREARRIR